MQLSSTFRPYDISNSSALGIDVSIIAFSARASSSGTVPILTCPSPSAACQPIHNLTMVTPTTEPSNSPRHECVICKLRHSAKRSADKNKSLHRSSCVAAKEPRVLTDMTNKVVRARATRLTTLDVTKALQDAIHDAQLHIPDAPPACAAAVAEISMLCGADNAAAASIAQADDNNDVGAANVAP
ncbi:hypothetical protein D1007_32829 [Hordeum vulgare]|nr:hypothetical protein D1007_32829 [Hordeum vulgare]